MDQNRRKFMKASASMAGLFVMQQMTGHWLAFAHEANAKKGKGFGLQLYSLRDDMPKDPKGVLQQVSDAGYKWIESYEHASLGMFWGMNAMEFKHYIDSLGMTMVSSHCNINTDFEKKAATAASIGMKYLICPYLGAQKSLDDYKRFADQFNKCGEICRKNGLRFAYHNHDYSFRLLGGQYPQDVMMKGTDPSLVDFEMDMYWVVTAGEDPVTWMKKYPNRFTLCHVKDRTKHAKDLSDSCTLGTGMIDYAAIARQASKSGMKYFIVEQEKYAGTTPLASMVTNAQYMKGIKW
jgi:sugar phosphate isomerase/epimerase